MYIEIVKKKKDFYHVYGDSIYIMNYLFKYKIIDNEKVGFPISSLSKVLNTLDKYYINYKVDNTVKNYGSKNKYHEYLVKGIKNKELNDKIGILESKLLNLSNDKIDTLIKYIEDDII